MRAKRRFEERKRKLRKLNSIYNWGFTSYNGLHIYRQWKQRCPWLSNDEEPIKWWNANIYRGMSESGHSAWVRIMMTKPHRTEASRLVRSITAGRVEPDESLFPVWGKPWIYYW